MEAWCRRAAQPIRRRSGGSPTLSARASRMVHILREAAFRPNLISWVNTASPRRRVRAAIRQLRKEGLVETRKGAGAFVREFRIIVRNETARVAASQWGTGKSVWEPDLEGRPLDIDSSSVSRGTAPGLIARVLDSDEVWIRRRRYLVEGRPVMTSTSYLPAAIADDTPITQADTGPGGIYARLADVGHAPAGFAPRSGVAFPR